MILLGAAQDIKNRDFPDWSAKLLSIIPLDGTENTFEFIKLKPYKGEQQDM